MTFFPDRKKWSETMSKHWRKRLSLFLRGWAGSIVVAVLIATSFKSAVADWNVVPTGSMKPTIVEGDRIFVNKLAYDLKVPYTTRQIAAWGDPERGDIVVFFSPADGKRLVKRVVGLPGDSISMRDNRLFINGKEIEHEPLDQEAAGESAHGSTRHKGFFMENLDGRRHPVSIAGDRPSFRSFGPVRVPGGSYFMMGDNRDYSADSRYFGFVERRRIVGCASFIVASLDRTDYYRPRWERFFKRLP